MPNGRVDAESSLHWWSLVLKRCGAVDMVTKRENFLLNNVVNVVVMEM